MLDSASEKRAIILFTRIPIPGHTKTRMMPWLNGEACADLHRAFLTDIHHQIQGIDADVFIYYARPGDPSGVKRIFGRRTGEPQTGWKHGEGRIQYREQVGDDLGARMYRAMEEVLSEGYDACVLTGTDLPDLTSSVFETAFQKLEDCDVVIGPTTDGGYYLIGSKTPQTACFENQEYGGSTVYENTTRAIIHNGLTLGEVEALSDMDTEDDAWERIHRMHSSPRIRRSATGRFLIERITISIIIPIFNEEKTIAAIQDDLLRYCRGCQVIFVDGGSTDATCEKILPGFQLIHSEKGRAKQMNAGARAASGDVLFFLHADSRIPHSTVEDIRHVMRTARVGCFHIGFTHKRFLMFTNRVLSDRRVKTEGIMFGDQGIFMERMLFEELGGFPEIPIMEDYQLSLTLKARGIPVHMAKSRIITSDRRYPRSTKGTLRLMKRMYDLRKWYRRGADVDKLAELYGDVRE